FAPDPVFPKDDAFTYLLTPRFKISPDLMVYARLASGYRTGGPNSNSTHNVLPIMKPDTTKNYELGVKGNFLDQKVSIDASIYYIDWSDIQLFTLYVLNQQTQFSVYVNADSAKSQGVELSVDLRPWQGLKVNFWSAWNTAELTSDIPSNLLT